MDLCNACRWPECNALVYRFAHTDIRLVDEIGPSDVDSVVRSDGYESADGKVVADTGSGRAEWNSADGSLSRTVVGRAREHDAVFIGVGRDVAPRHVNVSVTGTGEVVHRDPGLVLMINARNETGRRVHERLKRGAIVHRAKYIQFFTLLVRLKIQDKR